MSDAECFYFGCWGRAGHYMHAPGGVGVWDRCPEYYGDHIHLDGSLAPRRHKYTRAVVFQGQGRTREERQQLGYDSDEFPQGQFCRHELSSGYTAIQWWDRTQGDTRGACNSTILLRGKHTSEEMLAALAEHFPQVLARLTKAGVSLQEITIPTAPENQAAAGVPQ